jgi:hypothetical protein
MKPPHDSPAKPGRPPGRARRRARDEREHALAVARGAGRVQLPTALARKYPALETDWGWQWVFPAARDYFDRGLENLHRVPGGPSPKPRSGFDLHPTIPMQ